MNSLGRAKRVFWIVFEQGAASGGAFLLFFFVARKLGPAEFGALISIQVIAVLFSVVPAAWASIAITTFRAKEEEEIRLAGVALRRLAILLPPMAIGALIVVAVLSTGSRITVFEAFAAAVFTATLSVCEFLRRYLVRIRHTKLSAACLTVRWSTSVLAMFWLWNQQLNHETALVALVLGGSASLLVGAAGIWLLQLDIRACWASRVAVEMNRLAKPLLCQKGVVVVADLVLAVMIPALAGFEAYGTYQAILRFGGIFTLCGQFVEWHYAARLTRHSINARMTLLIQNVALAALSLLVIASAWYAQPLVSLLLGSEYVRYATLLPLLLVFQACNMLSQASLTELRILGYHHVYYLLGAIRAATAIVAIISLTLLPSITVTATWFMAGAVVQYIVLRLMFHRYQRALAGDNASHPPPAYRQAA